MNDDVSVRECKHCGKYVPETGDEMEGMFIATHFINEHPKVWEEEFLPQIEEM